MELKNLFFARVSLRGLQWFVLMLMGFYLIVALKAIWPFTIDDAYITLRYAKHWAYHGVPLFNLQGMPVEGYTSFSFLVLATFAIKCGFNPILFLKYTGVVSLFFCVLALHCLSRLFISEVFLYLVPFSFALYSGTLIWTVSGLETTLYIATLLWGLYYFLIGMGYSGAPFTNLKRRCALILSGGLFAFSAMTRPEFPALILIFFYSAWLNRAELARKACIGVQAHQREQLQTFYRGLAITAISFFMIWLPLFGWRWWYYGGFFPNSIACKRWNPAFLGLLNQNWLKLSWPFWVLSLPFLFEKKKIACFFLLPVLTYMFLLLSADPVSAFFNRLFLPAFALILIPAFGGLYFFLSKIKLDVRAIFLIGFSVMIFFVPWMSPHTLNLFSKNPVSGEHMRQEMAIWLNQHVSEDKAIVLGDVGLVSFLVQHPVIDTWCLNNREMGELNSRDMFVKFCKKVLKTPQLGAVILTALEQKRVLTYAPSDACLKEQLLNHSSFYLAKVMRSKDKFNTYRYEIYLPR